MTIAEQLSNMQTEINRLQRERYQLMRENIPYDHDAGHHDCSGSPIGLCVYRQDDVCNDHCIYCGLPEERK